MIRFNNKAEVAGLAARVSAFDGDGAALARNILIGKLAPSFQTILSNSEGPLMDLFSQFTERPEVAALPAPVDVHRPRAKPGRHPVPPSRRVNRPGSRPAAVQRRHPRRPSHEPIRAFAEPASQVPLTGLPSLRGRLRRDLAMDDLPDRGARRAPACCSATRAPGRSDRPPQAPEGTLAQTDSPGRPLQVGILEAMPGPGRHFYSPLEYETKLVKDEVIPPGKIGVVVSKVGKPLPEGTYLADDAGISRHPPQGAHARALPDQRLCLRRQGRGRRRLRRAQHAGQAQGRGPDVDPAGLCRRRDQQGQRPASPEVDRGIQKQVLQPGIYFLNPEEKRIDIVSIGYSETTLMVEAAESDRRQAD